MNDLHSIDTCTCKVCITYAYNLRNWLRKCATPLFVRTN